MALELVKHWGGSEQFVAELNRTGEVTVEHNVTLYGVKKVPRQIDVLVTHKTPLYTHKILIECKHWKAKVKRRQVDEMITAVADLGASQGVFFTTQGYQSGAEQMAKQSNISIFLVRDLTDEEWGGPGRNVHLYLQFFARAAIKHDKITTKYLVPSPSPHRPSPKSAFRDPEPGATSVHCRIGIGATETPLYRGGLSAEPVQTLEDLIEEESMSLLRKVYEGAPSVVLPDGEQPRRSEHRLVIAFAKPRLIPAERGAFLLSEIALTIVVQWWQSELKIDRMKPYNFAAVVEDCINKTRSIATRKTNEDVTVYTEIDPAKAPPPADEVLQNGMIMKHLMSTWVRPHADSD